MDVINVFMYLLSLIVILIFIDEIKIEKLKFKYLLYMMESKLKSYSSNKVKYKIRVGYCEFISLNFILNNLGLNLDNLEIFINRNIDFYKILYPDVNINTNQSYWFCINFVEYDYYSRIERNKRLLEIRIKILKDFIKTL